MQREIPPSCLSKKKPLESVWNEGSFREPEKGSISSDGSFAWIYRGPWLVVTSLKNRMNTESFTLSKASFADMLDDPSIVVSHVREMKDHLSPTDPNYNPYLLIIALVSSTSSNEPSSSVVCVYDARLGIIRRSIDIPMTVKLIEPIIISEEGQSASLVACVNKDLQSFHGLIAIGCHGGLVSFIDLCLDQEVEEVDAAIPRKMTYAARSSINRTYDMNGKRAIASVHRQHICLPLNSECQKKHFFVYRTGSEDGSSSPTGRLSTDPQPISGTNVTCLKYIPQINALCIAYNFGGYHVYDMKSLTILFSGSTQGVSSAVIDFSFQEPEDDPKNHCYLWLARGSTVKECGEYGVASIHLNVMSFKDKDWVEEFGYQYTNFVDSNCMFDYECTGFPYLADPETCSLSMIINCGTLEQGSPWYYKSNDGENSNDLSLYYVAWEATNESSSDAPLTYFGIFDINQWYQSQMPKSFSTSRDSSSLCPFFGIFSLTEVTNHLPNETILDFRIDPMTIQKYRSNVYNHDLHYYPSSLSFKSMALTEKSALDISYLGVQRMALKRISSAPPNILVDPKVLLKSFYSSGLLPTGHASDLDISGQREAVLLVMLQNEQLPFLISIIKSWSLGELDHIGCKLSFVSNWIWSHVNHIKSTMDEVTLPLFPSANSSAPPFDEAFGIGALISMKSDLENATFLLDKILEYGSNRMRSQDILEGKKRLARTKTISLYLKVLLWMIDCHLLPEVLDATKAGDNDVYYPKNALIRSYKERRKRLKENNPSLKHHQFLLIDAIVDSVKDDVSVLWKKLNGSSMFPPPSIHALLSIYDLDNVSIERKHEITQYFLMELVAAMDESKALIADRIKMFPTSLGLKSSLATFIEGIWGIDQGLYDFALPRLINPQVRRDYFAIREENDSRTTLFKSDIHNRIVTGLIFSEKLLEAQQFITICQLNQSAPSDEETPIPLTPDTITRAKVQIATLLTNRQILEAFSVVRRHQSNQRSDNPRIIDVNSDQDEIFLHFLHSCEKTSLFKQLFKLSLDDRERAKVEYYLQYLSKDIQAKHLLVLHLLTGNRISEAEKILHILRSSGDSQTLTEDLGILIDKYKKTLPSVVLDRSTPTDDIEDQMASESDVQSDYIIDTGNDDPETVPMTPKRRTKKSQAANVRTHVMRTRSTTKK